MHMGFHANLQVITIRFPDSLYLASQLPTTMGHFQLMMGYCWVWLTVLLGLVFHVPTIAALVRCTS